MKANAGRGHARRAGDVIGDGQGVGNEECMCCDWAAGGVILCGFIWLARSPLQQSSLFAFALVPFPSSLPSLALLSHLPYRSFPPPILPCATLNKHTPHHNVSRRARAPHHARFALFHI